MRNSLSLVLLLVTTVTGQGAPSGVRTNIADAPNIANMNTNIGFLSEAGKNTAMTLEAAQLAPSIEDMCMQASLRPAMTKGGLSDIVGNEVARRAIYLRKFPRLAGSGKWGCAASFYAARNPPSELGNLFGDLIDTTGCMDFTCDPFTGPRPINRFMNALLMGSMLNGMNAGHGMGLFPQQQQQPVQPQPGNLRQSTVPGANPAIPGQSVVSGASKPAVPASSPPAFNPPVNQPPQFTNQPATPQIPNQPATPPMSNPASSPPISNMQLMQALNDPNFQQQLMFLLNSMLGGTGSVTG